MQVDLFKATVDWIFEFFVSPFNAVYAFEQYYSKYKKGIPSFLRDRFVATKRLEHELEFAKMFPQYVIKTDYYACLGYRTFWVSNYPYAYGDEHLAGEWQKAIYLDGVKIAPMWFDSKSDFSCSVLPALKIRKALRAFLKGV